MDCVMNHRQYPKSSPFSTGSATRLRRAPGPSTDFAGSQVACTRRIISAECGKRGLMSRCPPPFQVSIKPLPPRHTSHVKFALTSLCIQNDSHVHGSRCPSDASPSYRCAILPPMRRRSCLLEGQQVRVWSEMLGCRGQVGGMS